MKQAMTQSAWAIFALQDTREFGRQIAAFLGTELAPHEEFLFEDGEHKARPLENVRDRDVFVIQSLYGDAQRSVSDKLCRLLFFLGALKDASAERVTVVAPYLAFARQDRRVEPRDPVASKYVAKLLEAAGADHVLTMDVHNLAAFENAFRCPTDNLEAAPLFADHFSKLNLTAPLSVVSPDAGGLKRARHFRKILSVRLGVDVGFAFVDKARDGGSVSSSRAVGDVEGRVVIVFDDMISGGKTMSSAAEACRRGGAVDVYAAATHGLFCGDASQRLSKAGLRQIVVADTVRALRLDPEFAARNLITLPSAVLFGEAMRGIHNGDSLESRASLLLPSKDGEAQNEKARPAH